MNITEIVKPVSTTTVPRVIHSLLQKHEFTKIEESNNSQQILVDDFSRKIEFDSKLYKVPLTLESKIYLAKDVLPRISKLVENDKILKVLTNFQTKMNSKISLEESVKSRISHPEDLVWQHGAEGMKAAIDAITYLAKNKNSITIKFDGSPSLLFGRDPADGRFVMTDKSGFNSKKYDGHVKSAKGLYDMLLVRNMDQEGRKEFATNMAKLWPLFERTVPKNFRGYYQGDLMYSSPPDEQNEYFVFSPNKISYLVPKNSELGQKVARSKACIVVHGFYKDRNSGVTPIQDVDNLQGNPELLVLNTTLDQGDNSPINIGNPPPMNAGPAIDKFLNPAIIKGQQISDLPRLIGSYMASLAKRGNNDYKNAPQRFLEWINNTSLTDRKKSNIRNYIKSDIEGYNAVWNAIVDVAKYKNVAKKQIDKISDQNIQAYLGDWKTHEGYVANTPFGTIKLVDRHIFMKE